MKPLYAQPLVHFVALGVLVFALDAFVRGPPRARDTSEPLVVSEATIDGLAAGLERDLGRAPTGAELESAVSAFVDRELLYRQARRLGLDEGDPIVRRRLIQKMQMVHEASDPTPLPTDAELRAFVEAHPERFVGPPRMSLEHLYFSKERHEDPTAAATAVVEAIGAGTAPLETSSDPFAAGRVFEARSRDQLAETFGRAFADTVFQLSVDDPPRWRVVNSSYGAHLVRITAPPTKRRPPFATIRNRARAALLDERRAQARADALERLRHEDRWEVQWP